jgi:mannonate dehydratase
MNRRDFVRLAAGVGGTVALAESVVAAQVTASRPSAPARNAGSAPAAKPLMKVGTQHGDSHEILQACAAFGVNNICSRLPAPRLDEAWSVDGLSKLRERVQSYGISLDMVPLPLSSNEISRSENPAITYEGKRLQKFVYKGLGPVKQDQGTLWPAR